MDRRLRQELANALASLGLHSDEAQRVAHWDPYDQNATAGWFDAEYMFGNAGGFEIVIGNPTYVQLQKKGGRLAGIYREAGFETFAGRGDIYQLFLEKGCRLLRPSAGILCYITSNSWLKAKSGEKTRRFLAERHTPLQALELGKDVFDAIVDACVLLAREGGSVRRNRNARRGYDVRPDWRFNQVPLRSTQLAGCSLGS